VTQGEKEGHNLLGIIYRDGLGVPVNIGSAKAYFQAAAQMDLAEAKVHLGELAGEQSTDLNGGHRWLIRCRA
jgi:TPR repeat protein